MYNPVVQVKLLNCTKNRNLVMCLATMSLSMQHVPYILFLALVVWWQPAYFKFHWVTCSFSTHLLLCLLTVLMSAETCKCVQKTQSSKFQTDIYQSFVLLIYISMSHCIIRAYKRFCVKCTLRPVSPLLSVNRWLMCRSFFIVMCFFKSVKFSPNVCMLVVLVVKFGRRKVVACRDLKWNPTQAWTYLNFPIWPSSAHFFDFVGVSWLFFLLALDLLVL